MKKSIPSLPVLVLSALLARHAGAAHVPLRPVPAGLDLHYAIAETYVKMKDFASARAVLRLALATDPADTRAAFRLASLHEEMGEPLLALAVLEETAGGDSARRESLMEMARIYGAMGQDWPALDCYLRAADLGERRAAAGMLNVGRRLYSQGHAERAREVFALVRTAFPGDMEAGQAVAGLGSGSRSANGVLP